jgi:hypothetical protein
LEWGCDPKARRAEKIAVGSHWRITKPGTSFPLGNKVEALEEAIDYIADALAAGELTFWGQIRACNVETVRGLDRS